MAEHSQREAAAAWKFEVRRRTGDTPSWRILTAGSVAASVTALLGVSHRLSLSTGHPWVLALGAALAVGVLVAAFRLHRRRLERVEAMVRRARSEAHRASCPRCGAPEELAVERVREALCPRCGAHLLEAAGLLVVSVSSPWWRRRRWRTAARRRLGPERARGRLGTPWPWLAAALFGLVGFSVLGAWLGSGAAPGTLEAEAGFGPAGSAAAQPSSPQPSSPQPSSQSSTRAARP